MVIETGAYILEGHYYTALTGNLTRGNAVISTSDTTTLITIAFPYGCGSSTTQCRFPSSIVTTDLGALTTIQTFKYNRRNDITLILTPHDATDTSYYIMSTI
jgi:hypothetical protein